MCAEIIERYGIRFMSKISVILPVYNGEQHIGRAIESVLNQTHQDLELVIVNDCSTDDTQQVLESYAAKDDRIRLFRNETNQKLPRTLNIGFAHAVGDYWTWTSDDNTYHLDALEKMCTVLDERAEIDLVYADFSAVDMQGNLLEEKKLGKPEEIRFQDNVGACFLYRKSLALKAGPYDETMFLAEDYEFFIRCYKHGKFCHIAEDLYDYGRHEANLSAVYRGGQISHQAFHVMDVHFDFLYGECHTQADQNRILWSMLALLVDRDEIAAVRRRFYALNHRFAAADLKKRMKWKLHEIKNLPIRALRKVKAVFTAKKKQGEQ